jgi:hypothetical protein
MKLLSLFCLPILFSSFASAQNPIVERLGVGGPLTFNGASFCLISTEQPNGDFYVQNYLPKNEKIESYGQMLVINVFISSLSSGMAAVLKASDLEQRMKTDSVCNYQISKSPDGNEVLVDYLTSESKDGKLSYVEFNMYRYKDIEVDGGKKAVLLYAYSKRKYGADISPFLETLKRDRKLYMKQMTLASVPEVIVAHRQKESTDKEKKN